MTITKRAFVATALVCATTIVSHSVGRSAYGLLLPAIEDDLGLTHSQAGIPSSGIFVVYVVGVLAVIFFSPRVEPIAIMRTALVLSMVALIIVATASSLAPLVVGVSLLGGAGAGIWMTAPVLATEHVSPHRRGLVIGALTSTIGLSNIALGVGTRSLRATTGNDILWRPIWWIALVVTVVVFVGLVIFARFAKTDRISTTGLDFSILRQLPHWKQVTLAYAFFGANAAGFSAFIVAAMEEHGDLSRSTATLVFSFVGVAGMICSPLAGAISDRVGRLKVMRVALLLLVVANGLVASGAGWVVALGAVLYGAASSTFPALIASYVRDSLGNRSFSQALAMMTILFSLTSAVLPTMVGAVADATGAFTWPYLLLAVLPLSAFVLIISTNTKPTPDVAAPDGRGRLSQH